MKKLVLVESPAKAKTIQKFVGKDTVVKSTYGHVRDLPKSVLGVDVDKNFEPSYLIPKKASPVVKELKAAAKGVDEVYLATDPDREGEAIAWHVAEALGLKPQQTHRILFHEITDTAIKHALDKPGKINIHLVDAQQGRRVLDRLVGYGLSPLLWQKLYRGLSAGRVQSAALRLIVDREAEVAAFVSQEYWSLWATFITKSKATFLAKLEKINGISLDKYPAETVIKDVMSFDSSNTWQVTQCQTEKKQRHPKAPFTTSTLQQEAGRKLGMSVKQTMMHAQKLYEGISLGGETVGLITYMRTDSLTMAESALQEAREVIATEFGKIYVPDQPKRYKTKSKGAQEAHEAVRPTKFARTPQSIQSYLSLHEFKLYKLIWERAMASQMSSADVESTTVSIEPTDKPQAVTYVARGYQIIFPGFLKVYEESVDTPSESDEPSTDQKLPELDKGDDLNLKDHEAKQHFTQPPPRFTEASLVKEMEKLGIGRPSTYSPTISTIIDRNYVIKNEGKFEPQEIGTIVINLLKEHFPSIVDLQFTADMEEKLDDVAEGTVDWHQVIKDFYTPFSILLAKTKQEVDKTKLVQEKTDEVCPECQKPLLLKMGRFGKFYACSGFPECRYTRPLVESEAEQSKAQELEGKTCPKDGGKLVMKSGRFGPFVACANYPTCKYIESIKKELGLLCPKDSGNIVELKSKRGKVFWGCDKYPKCDFASWDKPVDQKCPTCGSLMVDKRGAVVCPVCLKAESASGVSTTKKKSVTKTRKTKTTKTR